MVLRGDETKLFVKVERGTKPTLRVYEGLHKTLVTIPYDHATKWPILKAEMSAGITITVQRLEQQYKILIQQELEKKPTVCVYVNSVANEKNLKTCVKLINTKMSHVGIAGPNLEITGTVKAQKVTFESTFGALHTNAKLVAKYVVLNAQHIFIKPEAMYACQILRMVSRKVQIDGRIYPLETDTSFLNVYVDSALLHIGVDGLIGAHRMNSDGTTCSEVITDLLALKLTGSLANYGKIVSKIAIDLQIDGSILSLEDGRIDSAGRGYTALKQIKGIMSEMSSSLPTSSKLSKAIECQNPDTVAQLLEDGVDPNDFVTKTSPYWTPKKMAVSKYREIRDSEQRNKRREKITVIQALMITHDWRRGLITSHSINAKVGRDCEDCAQFRATTLELITLGSARCENDSIWTSGSVLLCISCDLVIEGQVKNTDFTVDCGGNIIVQQEGIISQEKYAKINSSALFTSGIWSVGENITIEANNASFFESSYIEGDLMNINLKEDCQLEGTWQTRFLVVLMSGSLRTLLKGKVLADESAQVSAKTFYCGGVWKVAEKLYINLKESANFQPSSVISTNLLKLFNEGCCIFSGHINVGHLFSYVRNDMITTVSGKIGISVNGTVATGAFRNDASWYSDRNLHLHAACFEQSEDAILCAKNILDLSIYDDSLEKSNGRIVANKFLLRVNQKARFDGYIRVNRMEMYLPYSNESQYIVGGQLEIIHGPLIIKGRSDFLLSETVFIPHVHPGFILEGHLKAEAVVAPFVAIGFTAASYALLAGMSSVGKVPYKAILSAGAIHTSRTSFIDSASADNYPEAVICATSWIHEGQFRFRGNTAYIVTNNFVNRGRLTNEGHLQNHMKSVYVSVGNRFENESVFSADNIYIYGDGKMENKNRIFATETMRICLSNFSNENGLMQSENIKLLSAGKEWAKVNGPIDATTKLDISATKSKVEIRNFDFRKQMKISAQAQLLINESIHDEQSMISFAARDAIIFDNCKVVTDSIDLKIGDAYETEIVLTANSILQSKHLRIFGKSKKLTVILDGIINADSIIMDSLIRNVKIIGKGTLISRNSINFDGKSAMIILAELRASEILGTSINLATKGIAKIQPIENTNTTTIYADSCTVEGRIFVSGKLILKSSSGVIRIDGEIIGTTLMSELSSEGNDVIVIGSISNFEFLEIYARRRIDYCETATITNTKNLAIEAQAIALHGKTLCFDTIIATAEELIVEGSLINEKSGNASLFARNVRFEGTAKGICRFEISSRNDAYIAGNISGVDYFGVDAKWLRCNPNLSDCNTLNFAAYSLVTDGKMNCETITVNTLGVVIIHNTINARQCYLNAAFIIALNEVKSLPEKSDVAALICVTNNSFTTKESQKICLSVLFDAANVDSNGCQEHWNGTINVIQQSFHSPIINCGNILTVLEFKDQLQAAAYAFSSSSKFFKKLKNLADRFRIEHPSVFNCLELLELMRQETDSLSTCQNLEKYWSQSKFETDGLCETVDGLRLRLLKYTSQSPQSSFDDYGYASRSSSEDIDDKVSFRESPTLLITKCEGGSDEHLENAGYEQMDGSVNGYKRNLSVSNRLSFSNDSSSMGKNDENVEEERDWNYVLNGEHKVPIVRINFDFFDVFGPKPRFDVSRQPTPTADLAMKKIQVKAALSNLDCRSFGSDWSLASFSTVEQATPMRIVRSPFRRSLIPRSSFRRTPVKN